MSYVPELDDGPREVRRGFAANIQSWWPKVPGTGNVQLAGAPTYRLYSPSGTLLAGPLAAATADVGDPGEQVTRVDLTINAADADTWDLDENYRAEVTWSFGGQERVSDVYFAVARAPYTPALSLNDFLEEAADAEEVLAGQAEALATGRTPEAHASVLAVRAWADVYGWLQARLRSEGGRIVPRAIVPRWKIERVVLAQALHRMWSADGGRRSSLSADEAGRWGEEARARFEALGEIDYDADDDGDVDEALRAPVSRRLVRSWDP